MVARDGIEPPTSAFSGPLTDSLKWGEIGDFTETKSAYAVCDLG